MWVRISRERSTIREKSQAGTFPPCRGRDAYPVLFPAAIVRFYATLWADARCESTVDSPQSIVDRQAARACIQFPHRAARAPSGQGREVQVVGVGPHDKLNKEI
jgi:hypothetical protein